MILGSPHIMRPIQRCQDRKPASFCSALRKLLGPSRSFGSSLTSHRDEAHSSLERHPSHYNPLHSFQLAKGDQKHYQQQYGDMYFLRLAMLKPAVEEIAAEAWDGNEVHSAMVRER